MQHLDEGLLMALLDGELNESDQEDAETHLRACSECSARLQELKGFMAEADGLVVALGEPPALSATKPSTGTSHQATAPARRRLTPRALAWAASIVAAVGLGFAGAGLLESGSQNLKVSEGVASQQDNAPAALPPAPTSTAPVEMAIQEERTSQPPNAGAGAVSAPGDERGRPEADSAGRFLNNQALAVRQNAGEAGQSGIASLDGDLADSRAVRDTPFPMAESVAKAAELTPSREARTDRFAPAAPSSTGARRERTANPMFQRITMEEAVRHLSGAIRLIDGLTPEEFAVAASDSTHPLVRVVYRVGSGESPLFLEQRRADNSFMASDLQRLPSSMEQVSAGNRLSWNDLRGFDLTLTGPISPDSLFHFKTLVK